MRRLICLSVAVVVVGAAALPSAARPQDPPQTETPDVPKVVTFKKHIKPILDKYCIKCHAGDHPAAGINLKELKGIMAAKNDDGNLVEPGSPDKSLLVWAIAGSHNEDKMPAGKPPKDKDGNPDPFGAKQAALIKAWIQQGAKAK